MYAEAVWNKCLPSEQSAVLTPAFLLLLCFPRNWLCISVAVSNIGGWMQGPWAASATSTQRDTNVLLNCYDFRCLIKRQIELLVLF